MPTPRSLCVAPLLLALCILFACKPKQESSKDSAQKSAGREPVNATSQKVGADGTSVTSAQDVGAPPPSDTLRWNLSTTLGDYVRGGHTSPKWDAQAKQALTTFAEVLATQNSPAGQAKMPALKAATAAAIAAGCDDLLVRYLAIKNEVIPSARPRDLGLSLSQVADQLAAAHYSHVRVFYASLRAARVLMNAMGKDHELTHKYRQQAARYLGLTLQDEKIPFTDVYTLCREMMVETEYSSSDLTPTWTQFEKPLLQNWPDQALTWSLEGWYHISQAWLDRGGGYANTVTEEGWRKFRNNLELARIALEKSWKLDPTDSHAPTQMITVALGLQWKREEMEKWFTRAMGANTNCYDACSAKLNFLAPKWYGSDEAMLAFARECATSPKWGGTVPLIMLDTHKSIISRLSTPEDVAAYWHREDVWRDLHEAFEKFFTLNPTETGWRHDYAKAAYNAGKWKVFLNQCDLMGPVNYQFFGGEASFRQLKAEVAQHLREDATAKP